MQTAAASPSHQPHGWRYVLSGFRKALTSHLSAGVDPRQNEAEADADLATGLTLERLLDEAGLFNFRMSRVQRALVRALDGTPQDAPAPAWSGYIKLDPDEMRAHFGLEKLPLVRPTVAIPMTGVRGGKTKIAAAALAHSVMTCSLRHVPSEQELADGVIPDADGMTGVGPGELVRAPIVTPKMSAGRQAFAYVLSFFKNSPRLKKYIVHETMEKLIVRRPRDGHHVLIELVAMAAGGTNLRSTWLAGLIFDEAAFADGSEGEDASVVNLMDNFGAAVTRMLPGALLLMPSSPWADSGFYYKTWKEARDSFGQLDEEGRPSTILSFHATSRQMNPALDRKLESDARRRNPQEAMREYDAVPLSTLTNLLIPPQVMARIVNTARSADDVHVPYKPHVDHYSGSDLGFRRNSSAVAIARCEERRVNDRPRDVAVLVYHEELIPQPGKPLQPSTVVKRFGAVCQSYGVTALEGDTIYADTAIEHLAELRGALVSYLEFDTSKYADLFTRFRDLAAEGLVEIPNDMRLTSQLSKILLVPGQKGQMQVVLPKQGRAHADLALSAVMALVRAADSVRHAPALDPRWDDWMPKMDTRGL